MDVRNISAATCFRVPVYILLPKPFKPPCQYKQALHRELPENHTTLYHQNKFPPRFGFAPRPTFFGKLCVCYHNTFSWRPKGYKICHMSSRLDMIIDYVMVWFRPHHSSRFGVWMQLVLKSLVKVAVSSEGALLLSPVRLEWKPFTTCLGLCCAAFVSLDRPDLWVMDTVTAAISRGSYWLWFLSAG